MSYDILALAQTLEASREGNLQDVGWIERSTREPEQFCAALAAAHAGVRAPRARSVPGERYDLYWDLVVRHLSPDRPALRWVDRNRGWLSLSFAELHARVTRRAGEWAAQGAAPGDVVAVVLHPGPACLVALLAALRMGLVSSLLPPLGDRFVARRLGGLKAKWIATDPVYLSLLAGFEKLVLREGGVAAPYPDRFHTFAPGEVCAQIFSMLYEPCDVPRPLTADDAWLGAVADATLVHRIRPGDSFAAPGFDPLRHQPALFFCTLAADATYVHLEEEDALASPALFADLQLRSAGITAALRDALRAAGKKPRVEHWLRAAEEPFDEPAWRGFVEDLGLGKVPASTLLVDAAQGGSALISARRRGADFRLLPAPGRPYALYDLATGEESITGHGLFAPRPAKKPHALGHAVLSRSGVELIYGGAAGSPDVDPPRLPRREGRVYPALEIEEAVAALPFVKGAVVLPVAGAGLVPRAIFELLIFTGEGDAAPTPPAGPARAEMVEREIALRVGRELLPDRVTFSPLWPRLTKERKIDRQYHEAQRRSGQLSKKEREPMFLALTALRRFCAEELAAP